MRELHLDKLKTPDDHGDDTAEAVVLFCGRFLQLLLWGPALRTCRLGIAEADRFKHSVVCLPDGQSLRRGEYRVAVSKP